MAFSATARQQLATVALATMLAACATAPALTPLDHTKGSAMSENAQAPSGSPTAQEGPGELITRTLTYLSELRRPEDATLSRFAELMGAGAAHGEGNYAEATWSDDRTGWLVTVSATEHGSPAVRYEAAHDRLNNDTLDVDLGPVCQVDLERMKAQLARMGFQPGPTSPAEHGYERYGATTYAFTRGTLMVDVLAQHQRGGSSKSGPMCVRRLEASFLSASREGL